MLSVSTYPPWKKIPKHVSCISPKRGKWPTSQLVHTYRNPTPRQVLLEGTQNLNLHLIVLHLITLSERSNLWMSEHAVRGKSFWLVKRLKNTVWMQVWVCLALHEDWKQMKTLAVVFKLKVGRDFLFYMMPNLSFVQISQTWLVILWLWELLLEGLLSPSSVQSLS